MLQDKIRNIFDRKYKIHVISLAVFFLLALVNDVFIFDDLKNIWILVLALLIHYVFLENVLRYLFKQKMYMGMTWDIEYIEDDNSNNEERKIGFKIMLGLYIFFSGLWLVTVL